LKPRERALRALCIEEGDKVPLTELGIMPPTSETILRRSPVITPMGNKLLTFQMLAKGRRDEFVKTVQRDYVELARKIGLDLIIVTSVPPKNYVPPKYQQIERFTWRALGVPLATFAGTRGAIIKYNPESDEMREIESSISIGGVQALREYVDRLEENKDLIRTVDATTLENLEFFVKEMGEERLITFSGMDGTFPGQTLSWITVMLECFYRDPNLAQRLIRLETRRAIEIGKAAIDFGAEAIWMWADYGTKNGPFFSPRIFERFILPSLKEHVKAFHKKDAFVLKHTDGCIKQIERELLVDSGIDAYQSIDPSAGMNIGEIKRKYGNRLCLIGNIDCAYTLPYGSPEDVSRETATCIRAASPGGGHILSSSNLIHRGVKPENYLTMIQTANKFGRYARKY